MSKKLTKLMVVIFILITQPIIAQNYEFLSTLNFTKQTIVYDRIFDYCYNLSYNDIDDDELAEQFYLENIPEEYAEAFLYYTQDRKDIRYPYYSLMMHESNGFKAFKHKNSDGSIDYGPGQLNSNNIENEWFMYCYSPKDKSHITTTYCEYMVVAMNFFTYLYDKYGLEHALYAYNGGEYVSRLIAKNYNGSRYASRVKSVKTYKTLVYNKMDKINNQLTDFIHNARVDFVNNKYKSFINRSILFEEIRIKNNNSPDSISKCINKLCHNTIFYIDRRKKFIYLEDEKLKIIHNAIINGFYVKGTQIYVA